MTNSSLKRFLTKDCKIRSFSSVSKFKTNMGMNNDNVYNMKSFRCLVYIHPEEVNKLLKSAVKFQTPTTTHSVFSEPDVP